VLPILFTAVTDCLRAGLLPEGNEFFCVWSHSKTQSNSRRRIR